MFYVLLYFYFFALRRHTQKQTIKQSSINKPQTFKISVWNSLGGTSHLLNRHLQEMSSTGSIKQIISKFLEDYNKNRTKKLLMVDSLMAYALVTAIIQVVYMILVGTFPFNSFLSAFFCHLGLFALAGKFPVIVHR